MRFSKNTGDKYVLWTQQSVCVPQRLCQEIWHHNVPYCRKAAERGFMECCVVRSQHWRWQWEVWVLGAYWLLIASLSFIDTALCSWQWHESSAFRQSLPHSTHSLTLSLSLRSPSLRYVMLRSLWNWLLRCSWGVVIGNILYFYFLIAATDPRYDCQILGSV